MLPAPDLFVAPQPAPSSLSSLDPPETPVEPAPASLLTQPTPDASGLIWTFRHSGTRYERKAVYESLLSTAVSFRRREAFAACGTSYWLLESRSRPGVFKLTADFCHDRWCPACGRLRANLVAGNVFAALRRQPARLVTLTVRASDRPLKDQLTRLYASFRRLRALPLWTRCVLGGIAVLELKYNETTERYHPHLHCLTHGLYMPQADLARDWLRSTGDSNIVDIRMVTTNEAATGYVSKYLAKPVDHAIYHSQNALRETIQALRGVKQLITYGDWRVLHLTRPIKEDDWKSIGHMHELAWKADGRIRDLFHAIIRNPRIALLREFTLVDLEEPPNNPPLPPTPPPHDTDPLMDDVHRIGPTPGQS